MTEDAYLVATMLANLRVAQRLVTDALPLTAAGVFEDAAVGIDVNEAFAHLAAAVGALEELVEKMQDEVEA